MTKWTEVQEWITEKQLRYQDGSFQNSETKICIGLFEVPFEDFSKKKKKIFQILSYKLDAYQLYAREKAYVQYKGHAIENNYHICNKIF